MKKQSATTKALLVAATKPPKPPAGKDSRVATANSFLYGPKHSSVAAPTKQSETNEVDRLIKEEDRFPDHHPAEMMKDGASRRFFFKHTNIPELGEGLKRVD